MVYLYEETAREFLPPIAVFQQVVKLIRENELASGLLAEAIWGDIHLAIKGGSVKDLAYGVRVRVGEEGKYATVVWDSAGQFLGVVEAMYLTYFRTAALLLALPYLKHLEVQRVLVMGAGRLGSACLMLAGHIYPHAELFVWSPTRRVLNSPWSVDKHDLHWWDPCAQQNDRFDVLLTCTRAQESLPLEHVQSAYVGVGGAVNHMRRELPQCWVEQAAQIYADDPQQACTKCGDLQGRVPQSLFSLNGDLTKPDNGESSQICFICGVGAIDIGVACAVLYAKPTIQAIN